MPRSRFGRLAPCFVALLGALALASRPTLGWAAPSEASAAEARQHFENGVRLFRDRNFGGALVEFDASFQLSPTAVALQNVAVCQKELFRYAEAIASLERLLKTFGTELSPEDRRAAEQAIREMRPLLGTLVLRVTPSDARVRLEDRAVAPEARDKPVLLAAGEYHVAVDAPGYEHFEQSVTIVSQKERVLEIALKSATGKLVVHGGDSQAAIAIDGVQVGYEDWSGPVPPGPHEVTVYTAKLRRRAAVMVLAGEKAVVDVTLAEKDDLPPAYEPTALTYAPPPPLRGWFVYATGSAEQLGLGQVSLDGGAKFKVKTAPDNGGAFVGLAGGYRFSTLWAAEFVVNTGKRTLHGCITTADDCTDTSASVQFTTTRAGLGARIMTAAHRARIFGSAGFGVVTDRLQLPEGYGKARTGVGLYGQGGGGVEVNFGHFLGSAAVLLGLETTSGLGVSNTDLGQPIGTVGLELRLGYGQW